MTATELLRNALVRAHEKRISLAKGSERVDVALDCVLERNRFEHEAQDGVWGPGHEAAVYALAGVDP